MVTSPSNTLFKRQPGLAVILSLLYPGLGQLYCGKFVRALILNLINSSLVLTSLYFIAFVYPARITLSIYFALAAVALTIYIILDAYRLAKNTEIPYTLKDYNRWYVYLLLILVSVSFGPGIGTQIRNNFYEAFWVPSSSMFPTIHNGDRILANKIVYLDEEPQRGDIIVFPNPDNRKIKAVKRIVAIPGDSVELKNNELYLNGRKLRRERISENQQKEEFFREHNDKANYKILLTSPQNQNSADFTKVIVPKGFCFVLGDNRNNSVDSRSYGLIPLATIIGRIDYIYFPGDDFSRFGKITNR